MVNHSENKNQKQASGFCFEASALSELELVESESNGHNQNMYYVYMIKNSSGKLYIGVTENLNKRLYYHNTKQGANFTKYKSKFEIVFEEKYQTLTEARKREIQIKKWRREKKEILIKRFVSGLPTKLS